MKNKITLLWILPLLTLLFAFTSIISDSGYTNKIIIKIDSDEDYEKAWQKVDSLQNKGLTRSALEVVEQIYEAAKEDNNQPQIIKSFIYKLKYANYTEEDSHQKIVNQVKEEIKTAPFPSNAILNSVLAQIYWQYYTYNRYRFQNRTETVNFDNEDFQTWDLARLVREIVKHHHLAIERSDSLEKIPITDFKEIIVYYNSGEAYLRSTLYDLLAHNALSFFVNDEASVTDPVYKFELRDETDFSLAEQFAKINFETRDSLSLKFFAIKLFQDVIAFHLKGENKDALIDIDLMRLNFVRSNSVNLNKDSLYLKTILEMEKRFEEVPYSSLISYNKAKYFYDEGKKYSPSISDQHKLDLKKAKEICDETIEKFGGTYGASACSWLKNQILLKNLTFQTEYGNIVGKPFRALVTYQNVNKIYIRIIPWSESKEKNTPKNDHQKVIEYYRAQNPIKEWSIDLPDDGDYQNHSVEIKMPELEASQYLILIGSDKNFTYSNNAIFYGKAWVSNISYVRREMTNNKVEVYTLHRETGQPLKNVDVDVFKYVYSPDLREYVKEEIGSGKTDYEGKFEFHRDNNSYGHYYFIFKKDKDRFESENYYNYYNPGEGNRTSTFFFLDRAIYRPGQKIYFKGLMINLNGKDKHKILTDRQTTVALFDANRQRVSDVSLTTNEYGTFNGSFVIPLGKIGGQYYLGNETDIKYFRVEEYKHPKFEVKFDPVKGSYSLNDKVTATGFAKTYSGANLNDVQVKYRVVRRATFPYFYYWCIRYYNWYNQNEMEITNGVTTTDKNGKFKIEFDLIPDLSILRETNPVFNYTVYADVIDVTGETHSSQTYVSAGYIALLSNVSLPEIINADSILEYPVSTTNLNGQFESANVSITVHKLKTPERIFRKRLWQMPDKFLMSKDEFYSSFEHDIYKDENEFYNWQKEEQVFETSLRTNDSSVIKFKNLNYWEPGKYFLSLKTKDKNGTPVLYEKYFTVFDPEADKIPLNNPVWIYVNEKAYEPGETLKLYIGSAEENVNALFEIEQDGEITKKNRLTLDNEQKEIEIPIVEDHRGNIVVHLTATVNNESHIITKVISVPWTNKYLNISFETFRNKLLPGSAEEWKLRIKDPDGKFASAEFLASMYDASLDVFAANFWGFNIYPYYSSRLNWNTDNTFSSVYFQSYQYEWNKYVYLNPLYYPYLNNFGFYFYGFGYGNYYGRMNSGVVMEDAGYDARLEKDELSVLPTSKVGKETSLQSGLVPEEEKQKQRDKEQLEEVPLRKNLNETAFFFPELITNDSGEVVISFTVPEALTRWKFMGFAHTKDLKSAVVYNETVTQKDLMVQPNPPRFLREGDEIFFTAKVSNLSDSALSGNATLLLFDALTNEPIDFLFENNDNIKNFSADSGSSVGLSWRLKVPYGKVEAVNYRVVAKSGNFSDGEENSLPVFLNRMLVTETLPLPVKGNQTKTFILKKLMENKSSTLQNYNLTLEFTANPAWYAIQALPYMMEYPYECTEQIFNRFYANSIATHIANSSPKIKKVFDDWKNIDTAALLSNLEKNQELKYALLEETPWVLDAQDETERKKRVGLLFDLMRMADELSRAEQKLKEKQYSNGGWAWFPGLPENRFITQYIVVGFGHLERLGIKDIRAKSSTWEMLKKAVLYTDIRMYEDYEWIKKQGILNKKNIGYIQAQYLYGRSYYLDIPVDEKHKEAFDYWKAQAQKYWLTNNKYMQGMIALALYRLYDTIIAKDIIKSIIENAVFNDEMGMYFKEEWGWYWYQAPIETQALLIEAVDEITKDRDVVDLMKIWLLKQKQVQDWKTTKATAEACYALLLRGTNWLAETKMPEIKIGSEILDLVDNPEIHIESGTGYFKTSWKNDDIKPEMGSLTVTNNNEVVSWGSLYWQYYEQLDKITPHETPLKIKKQLFKKINTDTGEKIIPVSKNTKLTPGDIVQVRIEIRVDRDMEFVHLKDMRASGFEPINVLSTHKYQDGLWYYENTRDAATNFFMDWLPKGTYVFEYPLRVIHKGDFSNGITTMQCMYAPEFASHSEGVRVNVQ